MDKSKDEIVEETVYSYGVRMLVKHPTMLVGEITAELGMDPEHSWNAGERKFTESTVWGRTSWTEGKRQFFDEIHDVLVWRHKKQEFVSRLLASGGEFQVIVQLPGVMNIGDALKPETMSLAVDLGVRIGIEVFPNLVQPKAVN